MLPAFYINLDRHPERRTHIEDELRRAGLSAERVSGVDGRDLPPDLAEYFDLNRKARHPLTAGQIGCHASHMKVMQLIRGRNLRAALVLEDDALLAHDLGDVIAQVLERLPSGWDIVRLCRPSKSAVRPLQKLPGDRFLVRYSRIPLGRAGYLVSSSGAAKLLTPRKMSRPGDVEISQSWHLGLDVYGIEPQPISQERCALPTTIGRGRGGGANMIIRAMPSPRRLAFHVCKLGPYWWARCCARNAMMKVWPGRIAQE